MKVIGQILLWIGFLSGSLATVFYSPKKGVESILKVTPEEALERGFELPDFSSVVVPEEGWHLIPWTWYLVSIAVCIAGIIVLRKGKSSEGQKSHQSQSSLTEIKTSLDRLITNVNLLAKETESLPPSKIAKRIDDDLADDFRVFADGRNSITAEFGLDVFADVMTQFAAGERAINRAWSASADGYIDEAAMCIDRGGELLREAQRILVEAKKQE
jgi:hypothetical protein